MNYSRVASVEVSQVGLDFAVARDLPAAVLKNVVAKALDSGVDFFSSLQPAETSMLGEALARLGARKRAVVTAGIPRFFAAYAGHPMSADEFLEHELSDRLSRLESNFVDCFTIDIGQGRGVDFEAVLKEPIPSGGHPPGAPATYEGGVFLHETLFDCLDVLSRFKKEGRIRLAGVSGENIAILKRILAKQRGFDVAFAPYNYGFRAAADELISIAAEVGTSFVATHPLWWGIREIPVTVLTESPFPRDRAAVRAPAAALSTAACKWPLAEKAVASVLAAVQSEALVEAVAAASGDSPWTKADEEFLRPVLDVATAHKGLFLILSAMNSADADVRARGWAAYVRRGLPDLGYDPAEPEAKRVEILERIAREVVAGEPVAREANIEELL